MLMQVSKFQIPILDQVDVTFRVFTFFKVIMHRLNFSGIVGNNGAAHTQEGTRW